VGTVAFYGSTIGVIVAEILLPRHRWHSENLDPIGVIVVSGLVFYLVALVATWVGAGLLGRSAELRHLGGLLVVIALAMCWPDLRTIQR
jgi:hypothetical protein